MAPVAREQVVAARAGKEHLHAALARELADVEDVERRRIGERLVELHHHPLEVGGHPVGIDADRLERDAEVLRDAARVREVVGLALVLAAGRLDGEAADSRVHLARERNHGARIEPARQERAHGDVGDHLPMHAAELRQAIPRPALRDAPAGDLDRLARQELADAGEGRALARAPEERQVAVERRAVELPRVRRDRQQALDLAAEREAALALGDVEWLHAERVARHQQPARACIPYRHREDAVEPREHVRTLLEVHVQQHLGVRVPAETVALRLELGAQLAVVVDLTVEDQLHAALVVRHRLVPQRREVDDREARVAEPGAGRGVVEFPGVIRTAMRDRTDACRQHGGFEATLESDDAAHGVCPGSPETFVPTCPKLRLDSTYRLDPGRLLSPHANSGRY